jgi:hypothetical protein
VKNCKFSFTVGLYSSGKTGFDAFLPQIK